MVILVSIIVYKRHYMGDKRSNMKEDIIRQITGKYSVAHLFLTDGDAAIEDYAVAQIQALCDNPVTEGCRIAVMPDVHPGVVGTIGYTQTVGRAIMPSVVGQDLGCGMLLANVKGRIKDWQRLDTVIRDKVPSGYDIRTGVQHMAETMDLEALHCCRHIQEDKALRSIGTLGGGNHFIEVDVDDEGQAYLIIHSGSRHLGKEVTDHYLAEGHRRLADRGIDVPYELTYLDGGLMQEYLDDIQIVQAFAELNRRVICQEIVRNMKWKILDEYSCIHNYVESAETSYCGLPIIRKGAISAASGERVIIPVNMRDGVILGTGLGNDEWNQSAPHGAGRIMSRENVKESFTVSQFRKAMKGIYTSCVGADTLDEAPFAYRGLDDIQQAIGETVRIDKVIRPVYNFKAGR